MEKRFSRGSVIGFYGVLSLVALGWLWLRGVPPHRLLTPGEPASLARELAVGVGFGLIVVILSQWAEHKIAAVSRLSNEIRELLPPLDRADIAIIALTSGIGEELFFRGAMQDAWGLWSTVLLFTIVHGFFIRRYWLWMVFAAIIAVAFGFMVVELGSLVAPSIAHITINYFNLHALNRGRELDGDET
jgi:membrane protease YdiL (CAAX protease family)